jgi:hypothetical protein
VDIRCALQVFESQVGGDATKVELSGSFPADDATAADEMHMTNHVH